MSKRKVIIALVVVIAATEFWLAFRPERLFINQKVNEQFPTASANNAKPITLSAGNFHSIAHETKG